MNIKRKYPPQSLRGILWSVKTSNLNLEKDKTYIIHQILRYGNLKQISWLFKTYGKNTIRRVFLEQPQKIYNLPNFYFIKDVVLKIKKRTLISKYDSTSLRNIRP
ncbi:MAG: hypothetical protein HYW34_01750 [Candidatus Brennerbacteria bacterium]|nr:hypothetical protein [Candidatus Brennerbacteria bacterium]